GPAATLPGALIGSMFGVGPTGSAVPSTRSLYAGITFIGGLRIVGGAGGNINVGNVPPNQNPNAIANVMSFSLTYQPKFLAGSTVTKSPGSGPPVVGPSVGTRIPFRGERFLQHLYFSMRVRGMMRVLGWIIVTFVAIIVI